MTTHLWLYWGVMVWGMLGMLSYMIVDTWPKLEHVGWVWYSFVQLIMAVATVIGWFLLPGFCLTHAWAGGTGLALVSIKDKRPIDGWRPAWLNTIYGNPEDGCSGRYALVWLNGTTQGSYTPPLWHSVPYPQTPLIEWPLFPRLKYWLWVAWRAYCWSAWRNSCDNLKYEFAWNDGPYKEIRLFGRTWRFGWHPESGIKVPVL